MLRNAVLRDRFDKDCAVQHMSPFRAVQAIPHVSRVVCPGTSRIQHVWTEHGHQRSDRSSCGKLLNNTAASPRATQSGWLGWAVSPSMLSPSLVPPTDYTRSPRGTTATRTHGSMPTNGMTLGSMAPSDDPVQANCTMPPVVSAIVHGTAVSSGGDRQGGQLMHGRSEGLGHVETHPSARHTPARGRSRAPSDLAQLRAALEGCDDQAAVLAALQSVTRTCRPSLATLTKLVSRYAKSGHWPCGFAIFCSLHIFCVEADLTIANAALWACKRGGDADAAWQVYLHMLEMNIPLDGISYKALVPVLAVISGRHVSRCDSLPCPSLKLPAPVHPTFCYHNWMQWQSNRNQPACSPLTHATLSHNGLYVQFELCIRFVVPLCACQAPRYVHHTVRNVKVRFSGSLDWTNIGNFFCMGRRFFEIWPGHAFLNLFEVVEYGRRDLDNECFNDIDIR
eukprot:jgi/Ulvmu1/10536/UM064_0074.1